MCTRFAAILVSGSHAMAGPDFDSIKHLNPYNEDLPITTGSFMSFFSSRFFSPVVG
jgi:hypothetical protein